MKTLGIFETKNRLSELCEDVAARKDTLIVTRHGKPLVRIVPYEESENTSSVWGSVKECQEKYGPLMDEFELPSREIEQNRQDPLG
jgi:prevent-host-death family protein